MRDFAIVVRVNNICDNGANANILLFLSFQGMFIDNVVEVAKRELNWEVDYLREVECTKRFQGLLIDYPDYYIPRIYGKYWYGVHCTCVF